jgi:hypothetical protein
MKLDQHILIVTLHIYSKFQAYNCASFRNNQVHVKIKEFFRTQFFTFKCELDLKPTKG